MTNLGRRAVAGLAQLIAALALLLFAPAWTLQFWQAWVYLVIFATSVALITGYLWRKDRRLLERRIYAGPGAERQRSQKFIQLSTGTIFIGIFILASLDHRLSWSNVPFSIVFIGDVAVALGFLVVFTVFRENTFTAATIEVSADQSVVTTGPYAIVRHPMYAGALIMLFGTPLALGSWWGLLLFIPMTAMLVWRLLDEETLLSRELPGYTAYCQKVHRRLIPSVW